MKRLLPLFLALLLCGWSTSVSAQDFRETGLSAASAASDDQREPYIDADGNRIPWYRPMPDDERTRSTVDLRFAPAQMKMIEASPAAAGATRYADYPVSYGLGLVDVSIPLYEIHSHSLSLPIRLTYDAGGVRVEDVSGPVGLGWTLEAGGVITRTVMGLSDTDNAGWATRPPGDPLSSDYQDDSYLSDVSKGLQDAATDLYSYNFCGHRGSFYVDWTTTPYTVIPTSATDLDIQIVGTGFAITTPDGTRYLFSQQETSARSTSITLPFYGAGSDPESYPQTTVPITAWYLTEIAAMDRTDVIRLHYKTYGSLVTTRHSNTRTYQVTYRYNAPADYLWRGADGLWDSFPVVTSLTGAYEAQTSWTPQYLDYISYPGGRVEFRYNANSSSLSTVRRSYPYILNYFTVRSVPPASASNTEVFRATFTIPFQNLDRRNLLTGLTLTGRNGAAIEGYTFTYIGAGTAMDPNSRDLFGYYNGADNSEGTAFLRLFSTDPFDETAADRSYNSVNVSNLSLETISTTSGSRTRFEYEGNTITTSGSGLLFSSLGIGHRIRRISIYDLSSGNETLVRKRDFTYSSPGITIPTYAFKHSSFLTVTEVFREDLVIGHPWWCGPANPIPRTATIALSDQSVLPGVPLENARIYYGTVTERVSGPSSSSPSVRTDYVFNTAGAQHAQTGVDWSPGSEQDAHDNTNNQHGLHLYHFFQRPPQYVYLNNYETSLNLSQPWYHFVPEDFPQLTSPSVVRQYKQTGGSESLIMQTTNEYAVNKNRILTGYRIRNMITQGDDSYASEDRHCADFYRAGLYQDVKWYRLLKTTQTETLDDLSTQFSATTYTYLPSSSPSTSIPGIGAVLSPKSRTTVFGGDASRTYVWTYIYPTEISGNVPWAAQIVSRGYRDAFQESVTAGNGSGSSTTTRSVTWAAFSPQDTTGMTIYRPSAVSLSRREPGATAPGNVGPNVAYGAYDRHGNVLQVRRDSEAPVTYLWGYGGMKPVMEVQGGYYTQVRTLVGASLLGTLSDGRPTAAQLTSVRNTLEASFSPLLVSWYVYDMPLGVSQSSDPSGRLTNYEYDGAGRLVTVKDENGNRIRSYAYALTSGAGGSPNSITSVVHAVSGSSTTAGVRDVAYFDGLGRTVQTVAVGAATASKDLVTPVVPDFLDREDAKAYLPYPATSSSAGSYRSGAVPAQQSYYGSGVRAYTENTYELSGRNRIVASSLPGFTETTTAQTAKSPAGTVLKLTYNASSKTLSAGGYHDAGRFVQTVTSGPDGSRAEVYTDELGTPVLERVRLTASGTTADTYYVRDVLGRVLCVVPPDQSALLGPSSSGFSTSNCYTYAYDGRDRVVKRQVPGKAEESISYNSLDLPETRSRRPADGTANSEVFTTVYDSFGRPVQETYKYGSNSAVTLAEYWYDSYPAGAPGFSAESGFVSSGEADPRTRGLKTAERVVLLPAGMSPSALTSSNTASKAFRSFHYDTKGRLRQIAEANVHGGTDRISTSYDFAGNPLKERQRIQPGSGQASHTLDRTYAYDSRLRLTSVSASLDGGTAATQTLGYDDLQRPSSVSRGGGLETTSLSYTLQGWLSSSVSTSWEETLRYASPQKSGTDALPGKAGLVTEWTQRQKGTSSDGATTAETYAYSYDKAGRLTGSLRYVGTSSSGVNTLTERDITYDRSGNLLTLKRYGNSSGTTPTEALSYSYAGPKRSTWTYDAHGNATSDPQGGTTLSWNVLDLPRTVTSGASSTLRSYLADGSLAQVADGTTTRLYLGNMVFIKAADGTVTLESAGWEGGRLLPGTGSDKVLYTVSDHLGSVRVVRDGSGTIRQRFDYYPYGTVSRVWPGSAATDGPEKRYRFGGKETAGSALTDPAGTGTAPGAPYLDFGARLYSPRTATWLSPDPLAEKYYAISPYTYCAGNPIMIMDKEGKSPIYDPLGNFLGTDQFGLSGNWIVLDPELFFQGMLFIDALNLSTTPSSIDAISKIEEHYNKLPTRPDYDGYVTALEGIRWAKQNPNALLNPNPHNTLYLDASKLDFGSLSSSDFLEEGVSYSKNLLNPSNIVLSKNNPRVFNTVYALGYFDIVLVDRERKKVRVINSKSADYDWNTGGEPLRKILIWGNNILFGINPKIHGFKTSYYGTGTLRD